MKNKSSLIHLATIFLAIIGCNAALLVGYILVYPSLTGTTFAENSIAQPSDIALSQSDILVNETPFTIPDASQNSQMNLENPQSITPDNTSSSNTVVGYDSAKQAIFNELAQNRKISENQEPYFLNPTQEPTQNPLRNYVPLQDSQDTYTPMQNAGESSIPPTSQDVYIPAQNTQETSIPLESAPEPNRYETDSQSNADNNSPVSIDNSTQNNTSGNTSLQPNTDTPAFIINTTTNYFHIPNNKNCKYLTRYTKANERMETNLSFDELISQGYLDCRFCFG